MMGVEAVKPCSDFKTNKISVNIATELVVAIDKFAISAVVKNILDNAIKFTLFGGWVRICASEDKDEDRIVIVIKDNGVGMKKNSTK
ncbi:MAG: hypothetical protein COB98_04745 [Flavobacteriaceae bacterium]|nr:MAG: hypothetical protein COB98_04745 [Flavobacteriaceae bacterium]